MNKDINDVYVVTRYEDDMYSKEPIVTVFDNEEAARKCFEYFKKLDTKIVCLDKCPIYKTFTVIS